MNQIFYAVIGREKSNSSELIFFFLLVLFHVELILIVIMHLIHLFHKILMSIHVLSHLLNNNKSFDNNVEYQNVQHNQIHREKL